MANIINLTPHAVNIATSGGEVVTIQPSGKVARVATQRRHVSSVEFNGKTIPLFSTVYGEVEGLPKPETDTVYIVSAMVKERAQRLDVLSPGNLMRDTNGNVVGCEGLDVSARASTSAPLPEKW